MTNTATKRKNITFIPTELNAFAYLSKHQKELSNQLNIARILVIVSLILNITMIAYTVYRDVEFVHPTTNVSMLEAIPDNELAD